MISIIICSRSKPLLDQVSRSVEATIGVPYEIIGVDNSQAGRGICEVYNTAARRAQYDILCFMHEDIKFHTANWGNIVAEALAPATAGVLGVAGSMFQPKAPGGWTAAGQPYLGINVIQTTGADSRLDYVNPAASSAVPAITLDGLWLCCRKHVWEEIKFDTVTFPGFHFYDIDFCVRVAARYTNYLLFTIRIEHLSNGNFDKVWMQNALVFYKKTKDKLPLAADQLPAAEKVKVNIKAMQVFINTLIVNEMPKSAILFCLVEAFKLAPFNRDTLYLAKRAIKGYLFLS